ncbi:MAG TPA: enoyl-CoA hydratase/isomerase family protein [Ornithinimicrobium sp.]|uniref:enoyl-CoA hydratase/isomerase family protein n=1 Tax=Ornithinimicrobium sp. TaxID=1977084 RepID=UPI002B45EE5F|nr:enoyl-CoA hydratase/isomerase family protein [Ornithinimicrobium sp.]HKJ11462.1 enoyl-CoA hydratase/isomerase family protein [Ornithinimicrobium sp.]
MSPSVEPTLRSWTSDGLGVIMLNRPRALNALDQDMIRSLHRSLEEWAEQDSVKAVWLCGAGDKGLCAGGDIRAVREAVCAGDPDSALQFFGEEYALNALVASYPKPYVAWMDGVVMGGGLGISGHGSHRLVTEATRVAMPETIIGFFPDVGVRWLLARAPGELGTHLALTGVTIDGADAVAVGLADALVSSADRDEVFADLRRQAREADAHPFSWCVPGPEHAVSGQQSGLAAQRTWVDECYAGRDAPTILQRLRGHGDPAAAEAAHQIETRSPYSVAVTLEAVRRARTMSLEQVLAQDLTLAARIIAHPDFAEGVRAQLVDKDRAPQWSHGQVSEVSAEEVHAAFE